MQESTLGQIFTNCAKMNNSKHQTSDFSRTAMMETLVFIFLVDHLPGNILNRSLEVLNVANIPTVMPTLSMQPHKCDYKITEPFLKVISKELDYVIVPEWLKHDNSTEIGAHTDDLMRNQLIDVEMNHNNLNYYSTELNTDSESINSVIALYDYKESEGKENLSKIWKISEKNEKLVAIFETLSNVTAQTCAALLLAPNWVVTAASCVGLLSNTYMTKTNSKEKSSYNVIVNATDPLIDGTVHNVTKILLNPVHEEGRSDEIQSFESNKKAIFRESINDITEKFQDISNKIKQSNKADAFSNKTDTLSNKMNVLSNKMDALSNKMNVLSNKMDALNNKTVIKDPLIEKVIFEETPSIALMRIDPPVDTNIVYIVDVDDAINVVVYRWAVLESESGAPVMHALAFESRLLPSLECAQRHNVTHLIQKELCLASEGVPQVIAGELSWCGPVLMPSGGAVALAHADNGSIVATPLAPYKKWIQGVLRAEKLGRQDLVTQYSSD